MYTFEFMIKGLALFLLACCPAGATTYTVNPGQSTSAIQRIIITALAGDTVSFTAGTYNVNVGFVLKCGVTITAAVPATPSNVVLSAGFPEESTDMFTLKSGCTKPTVISYLSSLHAGLLFVDTPNSNLTVTHNQVGDLKCCHSQIYSPALYFNDPGSSRRNFLTNATVTWNQLGDSTSCTAPQNGMTNADSPENYQGICAGMIVQTSVNGLTFENNTVVHVGEGVHLLCYGNNCSPEDKPPGPITRNVTAGFNDFNQIHRIAWEEQPQEISAVTLQYNSMHDWFDPYFGSFGLSLACCANPASSSPYLKVSSNLVAFNTVPSPPPYRFYGYGIEAWGTNASYLNNLVQTSNYTWASGGASAGPGIAWGFGTSSASNFSYNTTCGPVFARQGHIVSEGYAGVPAPAQTGNVTRSTCSAVTSAAPTISPASGAQSFPLTVTLTDAGLSSTTPAPNGNTGIWYTTDGSTPVPGSGTAQYLRSGGTFVLTAPATVKAVGMWGAPNQPTSYPAGYGFVPSAVLSAHYATGAASQQRRAR
jgi:hypothetical protein